MNKRLSVILVAALMTGCFIEGIYADDTTCPYDGDYKYTLRKAIVNYIQSPTTSQVTKDDLKTMLNFYLVHPSIIESDCSQGNINALIDRANRNIPDSVLGTLSAKALEAKCTECADGTACDEKNERGQSCMCQDLNQDAKNEVCRLNPFNAFSAGQDANNCLNDLACSSLSSSCKNGACTIACAGKQYALQCSNGVFTQCTVGKCKACCAGAPVLTTCDKCSDGTACSEKNTKDQTCQCRDINSDQKNEFCFLSTANISNTCDACADGTACSEKNSQGMECQCKDVNSDQKNEYCILRPEQPVLPECRECVDSTGTGTGCNQKNANGALCQCKDVNGDKKYEYCLIGNETPAQTCEKCYDGTSCNADNAQGMKCQCRDVNQDSKNEMCFLTSKPAPCEKCPDGTACNEANTKNQTCMCKDTNQDQTNDYCALNPPRPTVPTCESCPDGTVCAQTNNQDMMCRCMDINKDQKNEFCMLRYDPPIPTCDKCDDGTSCGQGATIGNPGCQCRDIDEDGRYELCIKWEKPVFPACEACSDGTKCGGQNGNMTCQCKDVNQDGRNEFCFRSERLPTCSECPDGTGCNQRNQQEQTCQCKDINQDGKTEYCALNPPRPIIPVCSACTDGTKCGSKNTSGASCGCKDVNNDKNYEFCYLTPMGRCMEQGVIFSEVNSNCCEGLQRNLFGEENQYTCTKCGDSKCERGETPEKCPQDCLQKCEQVGTLKAYTCPDGSTIKWCECKATAAGLNAWACINSPESQCKCNSSLQGDACTQAGGRVYCENGLCNCYCPTTPTTTIPVTCAKEGEKISFGKPACCAGLKNISNSQLAPSGCIAANDGAGFCTYCGNGICGIGENNCNCPADCPATCVKEGAYTSGPNVTNTCCQDLTARECTAPTPTIAGKCGATNCNGRQCTNCGNGQCEAGENRCNCPKDCLNICEAKLSGNPTSEEINLCKTKSGTMQCGNGWCGCVCPTNCLGEGQKGPGGPLSTGTTSPECCSGLTKLKAGYNDQCVQAVDGGYTCTYCGNGQCGAGENRCNCPQDCLTTTTGASTTIASTTTRPVPVQDCTSDSDCIDDATTCHVCVNQNWLRQNPQWARQNACAGTGRAICRCISGKCSVGTTCGDRECNTKYESYSNCPEDCPTATTTTAPADPNSAVVGVNPARTTISVGKTFTVTVGASAVSNVQGYSFRIGYDPAKLAVSELSTGNYMSACDSPYVFKSNKTGSVGVDAACLGNAVPTGENKNLASITFKALSGGSTSLDLTGTKISLANSAEAKVTETDGSATITT